MFNSSGAEAEERQRKEVTALCIQSLASSWVQYWKLGKCKFQQILKCYTLFKVKDASFKDGLKTHSLSQRPITRRQKPASNQGGERMESVHGAQGETCSRKKTAPREARAAELRPWLWSRAHTLRGQSGEQKSHCESACYALNPKFP